MPKCTTAIPISLLQVSRGRVVMYSVFGDESHDEKRQRVFAVAGLFGSHEDWAQIEARWLAACGNSRETCDLANVSDVYTAWPWEPARNGSDRKISGSSVARSWTRRRMPFTIG